MRDLSFLGALCAQMKEERPVLASPYTVTLSPFPRTVARDLAMRSYDPDGEFDTMTQILPFGRQLQNVMERAAVLTSGPEIVLSLSSGSSGEGILGLSGKDRQTTTRLLDAEFVKYRAIMPSDSNSHARPRCRTRRMPSAWSWSVRASRWYRSTSSTAG